MKNNSTAKGCALMFLIFAEIIIAIICIGGILINAPGFAHNAMDYDPNTGMGMSMLFAVLLVLSFLFNLWIARKTRKAGFHDMRNWLKTKSFCQYTYAIDSSGIAMDVISRAIYLIRYENKRPVEKKYSFDDVRKWSYVIPGKDTVISTGSVANAFLAGAYTLSSSIDATEDTGLTIEVKDITYPSWFIKFNPNKTVETELKRWMEILQQSINENANDTISQGDTANSIDSFVICSKCGFTNVPDTNYCGNCGNKLI